ncbi:glycosyltransferase family 2 protein [Gillisia limnaea]|uniref:Glycosyl transferase family 2 n=1 Tax=Gillisia limnaea (strain DSM 15749 / LMG 21470 / R-8282) TaxID=865937 RepID=H2BV76_GILLR|nr:glycosyltransferase family 2 protein [Gillisia limnaea]EHQ01741.1 glycosyl transferase family 2 [Gillisia limnaea DSM 15749]
MISPLVSIIIPTYNRAQLVEETLDSILQQTYRNWECLVIDDDSTDNTDEVVEKYMSKDSRFKYFKSPNHRPKGGNTARNIGFERSQGEFIHWFDSDDLMHKDNLRLKVNYLINNKDCDYCICKKVQFYEEDHKFYDQKKEIRLKITADVYEEYVLGKISILNVVPLWRKSALENKKLYDEKIHQLQDLDFFSRIIFENRNIGIIDMELIYVRRGNESITTHKNKLQIEINSFVEVHKRIIDRTPNHREIVLHSVKNLLWAMRWKMAERKYDEAQKCIELSFVYLRNLSLKNRLELFKVFVFYYVFKTLKTGDTKFKKLLKI